FPRLAGWTVMIVDVSGSMGSQLSRQSEFTRMSAAAAMAMLASEMCEHVSIYATAGNDGTRIQQTEKLMPLRGFALSDAILQAAERLGGGGIFTRQVLEFVRAVEGHTPERVI